MNELEQAIQLNINIDRQNAIRQSVQSVQSPVDQQQQFYNQQRILNAINYEQNVNNL